MILLSSALTPAFSAWIEPGWEFRRPIEVTWDAERSTGQQIAECKFYIAGTRKPGQAPLRITTSDGRIIPFHLLMNGPGDQVHVAFTLQKGIKSYYAYFGHPNPPALPEDAETFQFTSGLLMEMRRPPGGNFESPQQLQALWTRSQTLLGQTIIDRPFLGYNPIGEYSQTIAKISGILYIPMDGQYLLAGSADRAAIYLDGNPLLFVKHFVGNARYNATVQLNRGPHEFVMYQLRFGIDSPFSVGWQRPDSNRIEAIPRNAFGYCIRGIPGRMESLKGGLTADFLVENVGECFSSSNYSLRYRFSAASRPGAKYEWDFGDGQSASGPLVEHVYISKGIYPVRITAHLSANSNTQTFKISAQRDFEKIPNIPTDDPLLHSKIIAQYDPAKVPADSLPLILTLHHRTRQFDPMYATLDFLLCQTSHPDRNAVMQALTELNKNILSSPSAHPDRLLHAWSLVPQNSDLQPWAAKQYFNALLWYKGDPAAALKVIEPFAQSDDTTRRLYAQALILNQRADEGRKILQSLHPLSEPDRQIVISGAAARTIEYRIREKDTEAGEQAWDQWQSQYPSDFLEGYSLLLRVQLMEVNKLNSAAAQIAAAFAAAIPTSPYAPQLLDKASRLLADSDPTQSKSLRQTLKQRYPEDPLSQKPE